MNKPRSRLCLHMWPPPMAPWTSPKVGEPRQRPKPSANPPAQADLGSANPPPQGRSRQCKPNHHVSNQQAQARYMLQQKTQREERTQREESGERRARRGKEKEERKNHCKWEERKKIKVVYSGTGGGKNFFFFNVYKLYISFSKMKSYCTLCIRNWNLKSSWEDCWSNYLYFTVYLWR